LQTIAGHLARLPTDMESGDRVRLGSSWVVRQMLSDAGPG
jgi:hypothetical protein